MPGQGKHSPKWDECFKKVQAQGHSADSAAAICTKSVGESARYLREGDNILFVDPETFQLKEVTADEVPAVTAIVEVTAVTDPTANHDIRETSKEKSQMANGDGDPPEPDEKKGKAEARQESTRTLYWAEAVPLTEAVLDSGGKSVEVTLIRPGWSANGRYYSREALGRAAKVFEGSKAFINHPSLSEAKERPERDARDLAGYYTNVRQADDGSLRGRLKLIGRNGEEMWPLVQEAVTAKPDLLGLSINALGKTKVGEADGRKGVLVEDIVHAHSTDIVTTPAAGGRFDRLMASGDEFTARLLSSLEYEEWREARPDFVARIKNEMRTARKEELEQGAVQEAAALKATLAATETKLTEANAALAQAQKDLSDVRAAEARRESERVAETKLAESRLPKEWTDVLKPQLVGQKPEQMDALIAGEKKKFFALKLGVPVREATAEPLTTATYPELKPEATAVSEALGINPAANPLPHETPEEWAARVTQLRTRG